MPPTCQHVHLGFTGPRDEYWTDPATKTLIHGQHGHDKIRWYHDASDEIEIFAILLSTVRYAMDPTAQALAAPLGRVALREALERMTAMFPQFSLTEALRLSARQDQARDRARRRAAEGLGVGVSFHSQSIAQPISAALEHYQSKEGNLT